jgi:hypothetical protein
MKHEACYCEKCPSYDGWDICWKYKEKLVWKFLKAGAVIMQSTTCQYYQNNPKEDNRA